MNETFAKPSKEMTVYILLSAFFLGNALIAELTGSKIFSLENSLGFQSLNWPLFGDFRINLNMSVGILIWPIVFILSDIVNEYFGRSGVRRLSFIGAGMIGYAFVIIFISTQLAPAHFWQEINSKDIHGNPFDTNYAYTFIFRQGLGIIVGSIVAFLVSQFVDTYVFHYLRKLTDHKKLWLRATGSTAVSQLIDSYLILIIAFYWLGNWSFVEVVAVGTLQYFYKIAVAIALTPIIYWIHFVIDNYLGKESSEKLLNTAKIST